MHGHTSDAQIVSPGIGGTAREDKCNQAVV